jgi:hypothetical protein
LIDVAVGSAGQYPGGGRVLAAALDLLSELVDLGLQRGHTGFQAAGGLGRGYAPLTTRHL